MPTTPQDQAAALQQAARIQDQIAAHDAVFNRAHPQESWTSQESITKSFAELERHNKFIAELEEERDSYLAIATPNANTTAARSANAARRSSSDEVQLRRSGKFSTAGKVVSGLVLLGGFITVIAFKTGAGKPNRGSALTDSSAGLRGAALSNVTSAHPTLWSGDAAARYAGHVRAQQDRLDAITQADTQVADAVAAQADQVEHGRQELEQALAALVAGIAVAIAMTRCWVAAMAAGSPVAAAWEKALLVFGLGVALVAIVAAVEVLTELAKAGQHTKKIIDRATDTYRYVTNEITAAVPGTQRELVARSPLLFRKDFTLGGGPG